MIKCVAIAWCCLQTVAMKFILKHGKSDKDIENLRQEIEVSFHVFSIDLMQEVDELSKHISLTLICLCLYLVYSRSILASTVVTMYHEDIAERILEVVGPACNSFGGITVQILRQLKHENIIEMLDAFESPQEFCVVTEFGQVCPSFTALFHENAFSVLYTWN
jgi:hypothetical protein